jgi:hypothetical protein
VPPAYPETTDFTPGIRSKTASRHQKQPPPNVAFSSLASLSGSAVLAFSLPAAAFPLTRARDAPAFSPSFGYAWAARPRTAAIVMAVASGREDMAGLLNEWDVPTRREAALGPRPPGSG